MKSLLSAAVVLIAVAAPVQAAQIDWSKARTIKVVTTEYQFYPAKLTFKSGVVYRLHIENHGKELHEFHAPELFNSSDIEDPSVLNVDKTEVQVPPGQAKDLIFVAHRRGHYRLFCPDHDWAGMVGAITVN
ncbi:MAG TPA: cupredoxin domain-containing protein [Stellaceae bacterium]|jgi:uncharacterized cupredoxin-like copper-binding protein|nr:cupredoxin domain-containing protein [Stellaceae bacterium]